MEVALGVVALVVLWVLWTYNKHKAAAKRPASRAASPTRRAAATAPSGETFKWPALGDFDFAVVGESNYQATLQRIAGDHGTESAAADCMATLAPEDDNEYDKSAVQVSVEGAVVGYLSREDARSFRRRLGRKGLTGQATLCDAKVVGGRTKRGGEKQMYGIQLDMKPFEN